MINRKLNLISAVVLMCSLFACATEQTISNSKKSTDTGLAKPETPDHNIKLWPQREPSPPLVPEVEKRVSKILASMSIEEKVGQIIQPELKYVTPDDVRKYHLGSILNGGGTTPNNDKRAKLTDWVDLAEAFYQASMDESDGFQAIPLIWGSDAVHGHNNLFGATIFPHNIGLGAANDPELMYKIGSATATEMAASGLDWTFGPTVAVVRDLRWGRTYESYSEDPEIVSKFASKMVEGIQGDVRATGIDRSEKIVATAKHYLGDGGTINGVDRGDTLLSEAELKRIHAAGYITALDSDVMTTMASFNSWNGDRMHGHKYLLTDVLKRRMNFQGFVVGDWDGHSHLPGCSSAHCPDAINAGIDMFMAPSKWEPLWHNTLKDIKEGRIPLERLDDAVTRILRVKILAGLFEAGPVSKRVLAGKLDKVGNDEHRAIAREAVRKSLVLLKNNDQLLPLNPASKILVTGDGAHNIGKQSGGWTISWQGTGTNNDDFPNASSILDGIKEVVAKNGGSVDYQPNFDITSSISNPAEKPDVAVVVYGEDPYAEWHGDIMNIEYQYGTKTDLATLKALKEAGIPVVSILLSGRPLWMNKEINASDSFVAAWLPGTEGAGIADVIFANKDGQPNYDFHGRLSFSWPMHSHQASVNIGDRDYAPLFAFGYGLDYSDTVNLASTLNEQTSFPDSENLDDQWVFVSRVNSPWTLVIQDDEAEALTVDGNRKASAKDNNLTVMSVDRVSQEDARRVKWLGLRPATLSFSTRFPQDFDRYQEADAALIFDIKLHQKLDDQVLFNMSCGENCSGSLLLSGALDTTKLDEWQSVNIPLSCFVDRGLDLAKVDSVFALHSKTKADMTLSNIKVVPGVASRDCADL